MLRCEKCQHEDVSAKKYPCSKCDSVTNDLFEPKKQTNSDRIRSMSDEELAEFLFENTNCDCCNIQCPDKLNCPSMSSCYCRHLEWLQQEVEE